MSSKTNEERVARWKYLIAEYHKSGLSKIEFCRRHKIATSGFYTWFNRLSPISNLQSKAPVNFVPIKFSKEPSLADNPCQLQLKFPTGLALNFSGGVTPGFVKELVSILGEI